MAKTTVAVKFTGDVADLKRATGEAEREMEGFGSRVGPKLKTAMAGAGVAAGAVLASSFMESLDQEASSARMGAALGLSDAEAKELGKTAGDIYTAGWGESFDDVTKAVETVVSTIGDELDPSDIEAMTTKAIALADVFQLDVSEAVRATGFMLENELARDAEHAFDIITTALQKLPTEMRGEALEAISEYGANFAALGIDGEEAFGLILTAAQDTSVGVDKVGDSIKEFLIRATDGSASTLEAFEWLKLDAKEMSDAFLAGGDVAEEAFGRVVEALLSVEDPSYRAQIAVALFGTPIEDLSVDKIPAFLTALQGAKGGLGDVEGAADDVTEAMNTNQAAIESWKRKMEQSLVNFLAETVIPALEDLDENWGLTMELLGFYTEKASDRVVDALEFMAGGFSGPMKGAVDLLGVLQKISGISPDDVADAIGVDRNDELSDYLESIAPGGGGPSNIGNYFVPGTRIPLRARGGPVGFGDPYIVGEEGPELFVPAASGQIVPNGQMGGTVVNITNHYPKPERASESIQRMMRQAQYALGAGR